MCALHLMGFIWIKCLDTKSTKGIYLQNCLAEAPEVVKQKYKAVLSPVSVSFSFFLFHEWWQKVERVEECRNWNVSEMLVSEHWTVLARWLLSDFRARASIRPGLIPFTEKFLWALRKVWVAVRWMWLLSLRWQQKLGKHTGWQRAQVL